MVIAAESKGWLVAAVIAAAVVAAGCSGSDSAPKPGGAPPPTEVVVVTLQSQSVAVTTDLPGRTAAHRVAEVRPQVSGIVLQRLFREGADVKAGETLYRIDPATYQATFESAKAALAKAEANVMSVRSRAERYQELVEIKAVSQQDYDDAVAAMRQSEAEVASARAAVQSARINVDFTRVTAPISGRIGRSNVTEGALVTAGQATALATVQQLDPIYVDVTQSSTDILRLQRELASGALQSAGAKRAQVKLFLEDGSEYGRIGTLQFSEMSVDPSTGAVTLRAIFPNPERELLPGMFVRAKLSEGVSDDAIVVPQQGVTRNPQGEATALVVGPDGKVEQRKVMIARALGNRWLVKDGLKAGDRVIVEGLQKVKPGAVVKPVEKPAEPERDGAAPQKAAAAAPATTAR